MGKSNVAGMARVVLVASAALMCFANAAHASAVDVKSWLARAWEEAGTLPNFGDANLKWRVQRLYVPPEAQLDAMRRAVTGKPDHPDRMFLMNYERRVRGERDEIGRQLWCRGDGNWRHNADLQIVDQFTSQAKPTYIDTTVLPDRHWQLGADTLLVEPPDISPKSEIGGVTNVRADFATELGWLFTGGLANARQSKTTLGEVTTNGPKWSVVASNAVSAAGKEYRVRFDGRWDQAQSRGFIERGEIVAHQYKPEAVGTAWVLSDWRTDPATGKAIAWKVEKFKPGNILDERYVVDHFSAEAGKSFEEVTRTPPPEGNDALRGKLAFDSIMDLNKGVRIDLKTQTEQPLPFQPRRLTPETGKINWLVWVSSSCVVVGFGLAWFRRRKVLPPTGV